MAYQWLYMKDNANAEGGAPKATYEADDLIVWQVPIREQRGSSSSHLVISDAGTIFIENRFECSATSGDNRGIYNRLYFTGAGASGESLRSYTDVVGVVLGTAHGAHITLGFGESTVKGAVTGLGIAVRATLGLPNASMASGGTYAAIEAEIYAFGSSTQPSAVSELSFLRLTAGGNSTGRQEIDDKAFLMVVDGIAEGSGNMFVASDGEANYVTSARCKINGTVRWLMFASSSGS